MNRRLARPKAELVRGRRDWYRIENKKDAPPQVYIYDEIGYFGVTASDFVRDLSAVDASELTLHINSPGGDVFDAIAIYNAVRDHKATVTAVVDGLAASAASFIFQAGDTRVMNRNTELMIHDAMGLCVGNSSDMEEMKGLLDKASDNIASIYAGRSGGRVETFRAAMRSETWYTPGEAQDAGLADEVAGDVDGDRPEAAWDLSIFNYAGRASAPEPEVPTWDFSSFKRAFEEATA